MIVATPSLCARHRGRRAVCSNITPKAKRDSVIPLILILIHVSNEIGVPSIAQTATSGHIILSNLRRRPLAPIPWHEFAQTAHLPPQTVVNLLSIAPERLRTDRVFWAYLPALKDKSSPPHVY